MREREFVDALLTTITRTWPMATVMRPADSFTMGVPDVLAWIPMPGGRRGSAETQDYPWSVAIEAKALRPLMADPFHRGRRIGMMLKHEFTGPQISLLRMMKRTGVEAFGLVRASSDTAFRIEPEDIPAKTGNFTHEQLLELGAIIRRRTDGVWQFWRE